MPPSAQSSDFYDAEFYEEREAGSRASAEAIVPLVLERLPVRSVVDVGCGTGTWLSVFLRLNVADVQGVDGDYVDRSQLRIPAGAFHSADLSRPLVLNRRFDLAVCLEVAEHLPPESAPVLVRSLVGLSEVILFSAAAPLQGGSNHVNEQWPDYWADLFGACGYRPLDIIRPQVWNHPSVDSWYAQNAMVYASEAAIRKTPGLAQGALAPGQAPMRLIHPKAFEYLAQVRDHRRNLGVFWCAKALGRALRGALKRRARWGGP